MARTLPEWEAPSQKNSTRQRSGEFSMLRKLLLGLASLAVASVASGFIVIVIDPVSSAGAHSASTFPMSIINRTLKGDRLQSDQLPMHLASQPRPQSADNIGSESPAAAVPAKPEPKKAPLGCDPSFSPVVSPSLASIFGRCTT
jgi:hypothetical protein